MKLHPDKAGGRGDEAFFPAAASKEGAKEGLSFFLSGHVRTCLRERRNVRACARATAAAEGSAAATAAAEGTEDTVAETGSRGGCNVQRHSTHSGQCRTDSGHCLSTEPQWRAAGPHCHCSEK